MRKCDKLSLKQYEPGNVFFEYVLEWINVVVAAVAVVKLIMMAIENKRASR